jgi:flagellar biosynthesis protein FlhF
MQVKKFEARSMKEALEMVKTQLGPDAIILGVRDNKRSFGLVGEGSIEITAAVSEETLQRKRFAESRLREQDRLKLNNSPARVQKDFINRSVDNYQREQDREAPKPITRTRYIEIADEVDGMAVSTQPAAERIRGAAQRAWTAMNSNTEWLEASPTAATATSPKSSAKVAAFAGPAVASAPSSEVQSLKGEIASLRQIIQQFQNVPQQVNASPAVSQHPGAGYGLGYEMSAIFEKLTNAGMAPDITAEILTLAQTRMPAIKMKSKALIDAWVAKYILDTTKVTSEKNPSKVQVFVGPSGAGKTSALIKMASHLVVHDRKRIALVTTDTLKVGAAEQLRIYAQILNVPFAVVRQSSDWNGLMSQLSAFDHIMVDTPGFTLKSIEENSFLRNILPPEALQPAVHLVLEATSKDQDITEIGKRYRGHGFQDVVFTNLDQSVQHGTIYNFMKRFDTALHSFGIGSRVPEDFEMATKERVLDLIFKLTSLRKA